MADSVLAQIKLRAKSCQRRIIFPEQGDGRVINAIEDCLREQICCPVVLESAADLPEGCEVFWQQADAESWFQRAAETYARRREKDSLGVEEAAAQLRTQPLLLGTLLVNIGYVDAGVAGAVAATPDVIRASLKGIGLAVGSALVSSFFLMDHPQRVMTFADCGVNPSPNAQQLAQIAMDSASSHRMLTGETPRVAMLSFSTLGSANHPDIDKIREALALVKRSKPQLNIDGELQFDAAFVPTVAAQKAPDSELAGRANVFIFPDLNAGNIGYKIAERLGGAKATGPVLQGLAKPWLDLSRGCRAEDIVTAASIASLQVEHC